MRVRLAIAVLLGTFAAACGTPTSVAPQLSLNTASLQFLPTAVNTTEFPHTTTCSLPGTLSPNATCSSLVQFSPMASGTRSGSLTVNTSNAGSKTISIAGTGG